MTFRARNIKLFQKCPKLFLTDYESSEKGFPLIYYAESLVDAACKYLHIDKDDAFVGNTGDETTRSIEGIKTKTWAYQARFEKYNYRTKISFLKKNEDGYTYYVLCGVCYPHQDRAKQIYIDCWLMGECGIHISDVKLLHLNGDYVRQGELNYDELFVVSDVFYKENNRPGKDVKEAIKEVDIDVFDTLNKMSSIVNFGCEPEFSSECTKRGKCVYYNECFSGNDLCDDSVLFLNGSRKKYDYYMEGKRRISELVMGEDMDGTSLQYAQWLASYSGKDFIDANAVGEWMEDNLKYPLIYIDFEWDTIGIPLYEGMKPFDCLLFQYSIHIDDGHKLIHKEFLGKGGDSRKEFVEQMLKDVPSVGTLVAYNAEGAEKIRLKELANYYPEYKEQLEDLRNRMVDLSYPIMEGLFYSNKMRGTYSLKKLYAMITNNHGYNELDIGHGLDAVQAYRMMSIEGVDEEVRKELLEYCGLDTYAMVALVKYLKDAVAAKNKEYKEKYGRGI